MLKMNFDDWPIYFRERLWLGNPSSDVGIVTCWTPKEVVAQKIPNANFCLMGQLYSKRGINFLLRNILARPCIRHLYVVGLDKTGSGEALLALSKNGVEVVNGRTQIVGVENGYIDSQITLEAIEAFRKNVEIIDQRGAVSLAGIASTPVGCHRSGVSSTPASLGSAIGLWREPEIFPEDEVKSAETFPSEQTIFTIRRGQVGEAWVEILKHVLKFGSTQPTLYGGTKKELLNVVAIIDEETTSQPIVPEYLGLSEKDVQEYVSKVFVMERGDQPYTYGERLMAYDPAENRLPPFPINQIDLMVEKLKRYPAEVGALAVLWQPEVDNFSTRSPWRTPCLTLIQGVIRMDPGSSPRRPEAGRFLMTAYFRSNDMFGAWHLNAWALRHLQAQIAARLSCQLGPLTTISSCAHIYDNALAEASRVVLENDKLACRTDPRGNFTIEVVGAEILVKHLSPEGLVINEYKQDAKVPNAVQLLSNKIVQNLGISDISHALDLGAQLARAEEAVRHGLKFTQDRPLENSR